MSAAEPAPEREFEIVVITGLSGSGKTLAIRAFEDMGYFCVDNLPVALIPVFADLCARRPDLRRAALVVDVREGTFLKEFPAIFDGLRRTPGRRGRLLFFEADDEALMRRFSETRRPHPLASGGGLEDGIRREREMLQPLRDRADLIIDSSLFNVHELGALAIAVGIAAFIAIDGESNWLEGVQLLAIYVIVGIAFFLLPAA